ncbi:MAG: alkaline phosphatase D family protein [Verrucomicrobiota bacterium]
MNSKCLAVFALLPFLASTSPAATVYLAQGTIVGEVTQTSAILQARLTAADSPRDGDVPGAEGTVFFEVSTSPDFVRAIKTLNLTAKAENDYIAKALVSKLQPGTQYYYRVSGARGTALASIAYGGSFQTLPPRDAATRLSFVVGNCMNYAFFQVGQTKKDGTVTKAGYQGADKNLGYPAMDAILGLKPDFFVGAGDNVYYDHPGHTPAKTQAELRRKWHEQFVQPRLVKLFKFTPTYWLKDDHDYRWNDSDPSLPGEPSHALGIQTYFEQLPVVDPEEWRPDPYRTHRLNKLVQIWLVEGRDYRSPNKTPDGPEKSIWGARQKQWLQETLLESDATFKILLSPTPMVGPDDASKGDNHVNQKGFRHEGDAFFRWLAENKIRTDRFFIITGDRHWKYHSVHPSGYEEFSCGALNTENSRLGRNPGDGKSTDPEAKVKQLYTDKQPVGGFLKINVRPAERGEPADLQFVLHDDKGATLYKVERAAKQ